jgi:hypothetical protein
MTRKSAFTNGKKQKTSPIMIIGIIPVIMLAFSNADAKSVAKSRIGSIVDG